MALPLAYLLILPMWCTAVTSFIEQCHQNWQLIFSNVTWFMHLARTYSSTWQLGITGMHFYQLQMDTAILIAPLTSLTSIQPSPDLLRLCCLGLTSSATVKWINTFMMLVCQTMKKRRSFLWLQLRCEFMYVSNEKWNFVHNGIPYLSSLLHRRHSICKSLRTMGAALTFIQLSVIMLTFTCTEKMSQLWKEHFSSSRPN